MFSKPIIRDLEAALGRTPHLVRENLKYLSYDHVQKHFTCRSCSMKITTINDKEELITKNFNQHLNSTQHNQNTFPTSSIREKLMTAFKGKVPQIVKDNVNVICLSGDDYLCTICEEIIQTSDNLCQTSNKLSCHFALNSHEANTEKYIEILSQLHAIYGGIPDIVINHSDYISKVSSVTYQCTVCDIPLKVHPNEREETVKGFIDHLNSDTHQRNVQQVKAFSLVPELDYFFSILPNYMLRNIEYISMNGSDFFCSLCSNNISCSQDVFETKHNFRVHFLLTDHDKRLRDRMDLNNVVFAMLESLFRGFPLTVVDHLKYVSFVENKFGCNICSEVVIDGDKEDDAIREALSSHCESNDHESNVQCNIEQQSEILKDLDNLFGTVPLSIKDNIKHITFKNGVTFECTLCNETIKSKKNRNYVINTSSTKDNFESHLNSTEHIHGLETLACLEDEVKKELDSLFSHLPQFILNNIQHLGFQDGSEDYLLHCYLCDKEIAVASGSNKSDLTERNLRSHLFSEDHVTQLKNQANMEADTLYELESIFFKVPSVTLSGAEHLELQDDSYYCNLCKVSMKRSSGYLFSHFRGRNHRLLLGDLEDECTEAFYQLDRRFRRVPESVLRNIDFLMPNGNDLFCKLCQEYLPLDKNNLEGTKSFLKCHMNSQEHQSNLKEN